MRRNAALMMVLLAMLAVPAHAATDTVSHTQTRMRQCEQKAQDANAYHQCVVKATPKKCRRLVSARHHAFYSAQSQKAWFVCLRSCDEASVLSRTVGECSTVGTTAAAPTKK
jgi:hypothetical protein